MAGGSRRNADAALVAALAGGATTRDAAKAAGIGERTAYSRMADPAFKAQVQAARAELIEHAVARLAKASTTAVATLEQLLGKAMPPTVRLGAARAVLELGAKLREAEELEARISALEERLNQQEGRRWVS